LPFEKKKKKEKEKRKEQVDKTKTKKKHQKGFLVGRQQRTDFVSAS
jgi:hypothetical protein